MTTPYLSIPEAFRRQVARAPEAVAVGGVGEALTYGELDRRSDAWADALVARGVVPGDRVLVCVERSVSLVVGLLAILKASAAYLPVDLGEAPARLAGIVEDAEVRLALCDEVGAGVLAAHEVPVLLVGRSGETPTDTAARTPLDVPVPSADATAPAAPGVSVPLAGHAPAPRTEPEDVACVMYTSGSTGRPKGVLVPHRAVLNLVHEPNYVTLDGHDRILQLAPVAFDAATFEIWGALLNGARLEMAPAGPLGADALGGLLRERGITVLWLTAALFHRQIDFDAGSLSSLRVLLAGGDVLSVEHVRRLRAAAPELRIVNGYGPTEATTFSLCHRIAPDEEFPRSVPIGVPVQGTEAQLRDDSGTVVPEGAEGELWIAGAGVGLGYWRRPDLTAERFVTDTDGRTWYRTGDLARQRADGIHEFLGRIDGQVKLLGHRVEPGEIENLLAECPPIGQAAVGVRTNLVGDPKLIAWVTLTGPLDRRALRARLRRELPEYMVPTLFAAVDALPVTANGKVDRNALPTPDWRRKENYV
ncbi:amino acid adenylation domain-containing protein [Streptomyces sp. NBC_00140]|uniref:amino acid adenylation domain-containing protein n=1 Tax=Streptomyces sp. NBC_00140 TaxID=2975664 RepID=UPI002256971E|nr:amino acid adenylation domain-containing protein [Streptomyces sp. NBC_00140]MCX5331783.1 amino acid adenylation domain-containing protein [Streptomyces sp. NBC_00140]